MTDDLKSRVTEDMKTAMRAKDARKLGVIRMLLAAIKQKEIDERITINDSQVLGVLNTMIKQRRASVVEFEKAKRQDLVDQENFEIEILQIYLPEQLSDDKVKEIVQQAITETGASSMKDMGAVMGMLKAKMEGQTDMGKVSALVKASLQN